MPRRGPVPKRKLPPDYVYNSVLVHRLINQVMRKGKKSIAEKICYTALKRVKERVHDDELKVLEKAIENLKPKVAVKPRRVGGATYQVPIEVLPERQVSLALRWLVEYARLRPGKSMVDKLSAEIIDAFKQQGGAFKKREEVHRVAEANRAFAHYRW